MGQDEHRHVEWWLVTPTFCGVVHPSSDDPRSHPRERLLHDLRVLVRLATLQPVRLTPRLEPVDPLVEFLAVVPEPASLAALAPYLGTVSTVDVYVDRSTIIGLEAVAATAGLRPIEGGRLALRPFLLGAQVAVEARLAPTGTAPAAVRRSTPGTTTQRPNEVAASGT